MNKTGAANGKQIHLTKPVFSFPYSFPEACNKHTWIYLLGRLSFEYPGSAGAGPQQFTLSKCTHQCFVYSESCATSPPSNNNEPKTYNSLAVIPDHLYSYVPGLLTLKFHLHLFPDF